MIFRSACCGKKVHSPVELDIPKERDDYSENLVAKMRTVRRKGMILLNRFAVGMCTVIEKCGGEIAQSEGKV